MLIVHLVQMICFFCVLLVAIPVFGAYIAAIFNKTPTFLTHLLRWLEVLSYRLGNINPDEEMGWGRYAKSMLLFNLWGLLFLFLIQITQSFLPLNPQNFPNVSWDLALNTAISFVTNTNWQGYPGETTMSYATQMVGLTVQNFLSAATGLSVLMALVRGLIRKNIHTIGNFWSDSIRSIVYLLLPLSMIISLILVSQGVVQTFSPYLEVTTYEGNHQTIPLGPVASQIAIKQLGSNGGGFFNTNSAHPFENPTPISNMIEMVLIILIPAATVYAYGIIVNSRRHAWILLGVMFALLSGGLALSTYSEGLSNPILEVGQNLEGKEIRFGGTNSLLWAIATTSTSCGSVNMMHESLSPLAGGVCLLNMMFGELIFGGIGVGLCSMLMFVLLTVFISGLMVGRTPEYMGKKIEKYDIQWVMLAVLTPNALILIGAGISCVLPVALSSLSTSGPHGFSELLYTFTSAAVNNGSSFAGINGNTLFLNLSLGLVMLLGRLAILVPCLALAGNLSSKRITPLSSGTLSTETLLFSILLFSFIMIICALTFLPALALGPIIEHLLMLRGQAF